MNRYDQEIYGSVGGAEVQPRYIGSAEVQPRYVGASAVDTGALTGDTVNYSGIQYRPQTQPDPGKSRLPRLSQIAPLPHSV